jgi:hypothetical protein
LRDSPGTNESRWLTSSFAALAFLREAEVEILTVVAGRERHGGTPRAFAECGVLLPERAGESSGESSGRSSGAG